LTELKRQKICQDDYETGRTDFRGQVRNHRNNYPFLLVYYFLEETNLWWALERSLP
jgi:hypothetical protein